MRKFLGAVVVTLALAGCGGAEPDPAERAAYLAAMDAVGVTDAYAEKSARAACESPSDAAGVRRLWDGAPEEQRALLRIFASHGVAGYCPERADAWASVR